MINCTAANWLRNTDLRVVSHLSRHINLYQLSLQSVERIVCKVMPKCFAEVTWHPSWRWQQLRLSRASSSYCLTVYFYQSLQFCKWNQLKKRGHNLTDLWFGIVCRQTSSFYVHLVCVALAIKIYKENQLLSYFEFFIPVATYVWCPCCQNLSHEYFVLFVL